MAGQRDTGVKQKTLKEHKLSLEQHYKNLAQKDVEERTKHVFRPNIKYILTYSALPILVSFILAKTFHLNHFLSKPSSAVFLNPSGLISLSLIYFLLFMLFTEAVFLFYMDASYRVVLTPSGIKGPHHFIPIPFIKDSKLRLSWSEIAQVERVDVLFLQFFVLKDGIHRPLVYLPGGLEGMEEFKRLVKAYAGDAHPLSVALTGPD